MMRIVSSAWGGGCMTANLAARSAIPRSAAAAVTGAGLAPIAALHRRLASSSSSSSAATGNGGTPYTSPAEYFGVNSFDHLTMQKYMTPGLFDAFEKSLQSSEPMPREVCEAVAAAMHQWAKERGATHFTHWFQPLTGGTAEKHDAFLKVSRGNRALSAMSAKNLIRGEADGSSFPSGALRATHSARGYTMWDPHSIPFILDHDNGATLYVPAMFFTWEGQAMDEKIPLLRSNRSLAKQVLRLLAVAGEPGHTRLHANSGVEQEFFLIDRNYYLQRPDLVTTGRTLIGARPPKGQELSDQYFAAISKRALRCMNDAELELWKLGIPMQCRHREVAPGQYELAPLYAEGNVAADRNMLMMEILRRVARKHEMAVLFHEKPFAGINGSGKHNNWSIGTDRTPILFEPGTQPLENIPFWLIMAATVRAVNLHGDLLRVAITGAGNDHRLGGHEAPPAIMSVYLGENISNLMQQFISGQKSAPSSASSATADLNDKTGLNYRLDLGIPHLPIFQRDLNDRNRTSPVAFTGDRFEFRAVGSSQNPSRSTMTLNSIVADSANHMADAIEATLAQSGGAGCDRRAAAIAVIRKTLTDNARVLFDGNNYAAEWVREAERRGLPNLKNTPAALETYNSDKNRQLLERENILTAAELQMRSDVYTAEYVNRLAIEARQMTQLAYQHVYPSGWKYLKSLKAAGASGDSVENRLEANLRSVGDAARALEDVTAEVDAAHSPSATFAAEKLIGPMESLRAACDSVEKLVDLKNWNLPSYHDMLFHQD